MLLSAHTRLFSLQAGYDSGCTAVVGLVRGHHLVVANAGDSRCVVCRSGQALDMSLDHKPEDAAEYNRIRNAGGRVTKEGRVNGGLNLSRAIGQCATNYLLTASISRKVQATVIQHSTPSYMSCKSLRKRELQLGELKPYKLYIVLHVCMHALTDCSFFILNMVFEKHLCFSDKWRSSWCTLDALLTE